MKLLINENEIVDGICVYIANEMNTDPEEVDVTEISAKADGEIIARTKTFGDTHLLGPEEILEGIFQFLEEFHNFNRQGMHGSLHFNKREGFSAELFVNE